MTQPPQTPGQQLTEEQAMALITRLVGTEAQMELRPFEYGWLAREILSEQEKAQGMQIGQGSYIIDSTGVITAHRSLPPVLIIREYVEARRQGRISGCQVWPDPNRPQPIP